jgi:Fe-S oxidoreductase
MAVDRVRTAVETGADIIATACPFCETNLLAGVGIEGVETRVIDVVDLLVESLSK